MDGIVVGIVVAVFLALTLTLVIVFVFPVIVLGLELLLAGLLVIARLLLGHWTVVARSGDAGMSWSVRGRSRAVALASEVAHALQSGTPLPDGARLD